MFFVHFSTTEDKNGKKSKQKENPFSFKKFLAGSSSSATNSSSNKSANTASFAPPDIASDIDIPSLHNDNFSKVIPIPTQSVLRQSDENDDDDGSSFSLFAPPFDNNLNISKSTSNKPIPQRSSERAPANGDPFSASSLNNDDDELEDSGAFQGTLGSSASGETLQLPDFLSDGPLLSSAINKSLSSKNNRDEDLLSQIQIVSHVLSK